MGTYTILAKALKPVVKQITKSAIKVTGKQVALEVLDCSAVIAGGLLGNKIFKEIKKKGEEKPNKKAKKKEVTNIVAKEEVKEETVEERLAKLEKENARLKSEIFYQRYRTSAMAINNLINSSHHHSTTKGAHRVPESMKKDVII